jgi:hypothetical protein
MVWYPAIGWLVGVISFIVAIILFVIYKKLYNIFYLISISLYIFTRSFMIDVYDFEKLGILITLIISAIIFMLLGYYLSIIFSKEQPLKK